MGRLEKQIIAGAIALVAILLGIVVLKGVDPNQPENKPQKSPEWQEPGLLLSSNATDREKERQGGSSEDLAEQMSLDGESQLKAQPSPAPSEPKKPAVEEEGPLSEPQPKQPESAELLPLEEQVVLYTVKSGETLSEIAQRELGSMRNVDLILELNEGLTKNNVRAGAEIWLPSREDVQTRRDSSSSKAKDKPAARQAGRVHTVSAGDSLWNLAVKYYGRNDANAGMKRIVAANAQLKSEDTVLRLGWDLVVPE